MQRQIEISPKFGFKPRRAVSVKKGTENSEEVDQRMLDKIPEIQQDYSPEQVKEQPPKVISYFKSFEEDYSSHMVLVVGNIDIKSLKMVEALAKTKLSWKMKLVKSFGEANE